MMCKNIMLSKGSQSQDHMYNFIYMKFSKRQILETED